MERAGKARVLLADDHETILARERSILDKDFEVVGEVTNGRDAVDEVRHLDPDVLVIDISMPVLDGLQAASQLRQKGYRTKVVFLTVHEDRDFVEAAFAAGASGYVTKSRLASDLVEAVRAVLRGCTFVSHSIPPCY